MVAGFLVSVYFVVPVTQGTNESGPTSLAGPELTVFPMSHVWHTQNCGLRFFHTNLYSNVQTRLICFPLPLFHLSLGTPGQPVSLEGFNVTVPFLSGALSGGIVVGSS